MKRHAGSRSPSTRTLNCGLERPSSFTALARHDGGMRRSGSSCMGHLKLALSAPAMPASVEVVQTKV